MQPPKITNSLNTKCFFTKTQHLNISSLEIYRWIREVKAYARTVSFVPRCNLVNAISLQTNTCKAIQELQCIIFVILCF